MYSAIPTCEKRIQLLKNIKKILKPGGILITHFFYQKPTANKKLIYTIQKIISYITFGNTKFQLGDTVLPTMEFYHFFKDTNEIYYEAKTALLNIEEIKIKNNSGYGIFRS